MTGGPRVLICDDEPGIRKTLSQILGDEGYTVDAVGLGQDALARALDENGQRPEAIFLDVWLPDIDGLMVLDRLRAAGLETPVVMISGHGTVETAVQAVKRGADDFLEKPLSLERVLLTLDKALERRSLARERDDLRRELMSRTGEDAARETLPGTGSAMTRLLDEIRRAGASEAR
ncbi:MAG TPA: response regulator, partial [Thermoanaerobaculia bacterium]|nr:response regulator [Thermoanaerobaculia bacterium]